MPASLDGVRVDRAVCLLSERSRAAAAALIEGGGVRLDDHPVRRGSTVLRAGQRLVVDDSAAEGSGSPALVPDRSVAYEVVFADDDVIVVDKPAGLVVHPGAGHRTGTLVHGLLGPVPRPGRAWLRVGGPTPSGRASCTASTGARRDSWSWPERSRPASPSSPSSPTTGSSAPIGHWCTERWSRTTGVVDAPIGRSARVPTRMAVQRHGPPGPHPVPRRPALRPTRVRQRFLTVSLETGRTHQIRVHLAAIGHPVVADDAYGRGRRWPETTLERPFLHASALRFDHPATGEAVSFASPLPPDLEAELARIAG